MWLYPSSLGKVVTFGSAPSAQAAGTSRGTSWRPAGRSRRDWDRSGRARAPSRMPRTWWAIVASLPCCSSSSSVSAIGGTWLGDDDFGLLTHESSSLLIAADRLPILHHAPAILVNSRYDAVGQGGAPMLYDLSPTIRPETPVWPGDTPFQSRLTLVDRRRRERQSLGDHHDAAPRLARRRAVPHRGARRGDGGDAARAATSGPAGWCGCRRSR